MTTGTKKSAAGDAIYKQANRDGAEKFPRKGVPCLAGETGEEIGRNAAALATAPELAAYRVIGVAERTSGVGDVLDLPTMLETLRGQAAVVNRGDLSQAEAMLANQATALQSLFVRLVERGINQEYLPQYEAHMRLALRAQSQCVRTLEVLAAIKNPPVVYARQANLAMGAQQVNNGVAVSSQAREIETEQTQLLRADDGSRLDIGTAGAAIGSNPAMAALGEIDRAEVPRG